MSGINPHLYVFPPQLRDSHQPKSNSTALLLHLSLMATRATVVKHIYGKIKNAMGHMAFSLSLSGAAPFVCWGMRSSASWTAASMAPLSLHCLRLFITLRSGHIAQQTSKLMHGAMKNRISRFSSQIKGCCMLIRTYCTDEGLDHG